MRYIFSLIFILSSVLLSASEMYPVMFSQQGTPLYKAAARFDRLQSYDSLKADVISYSKDAQKTKELGFDADFSQNEKQIKTYLKSLRKLQQQHDNIVKLSIKNLLKAIKENNYKDFSFLVEYGIDYFKDKDRLKNKIFSFYKKNKSKKTIASLDDIIKKDKYTIKNDSQYVYKKIGNNNVEARTKKITIITSSGCKWCKKLKALLDENGESYSELDIKSSAGSRLYKKYNGRGVPLTIIDGEVYRGYNRNSILQAIE